MAAGGITSAPARIQKRLAGDPIATRARFVAGLPPRSGWLGSRPAIADTVGSPGPDAGASCTGRGALAKHGPAGPTPRGPLPRRIEFFKIEHQIRIFERGLLPTATLLPIRQ